MIHIFHFCSLGLVRYENHLRKLSQSTLMKWDFNEIPSKEDRFWFTVGCITLPKCYPYGQLTFFRNFCNDIISYCPIVSNFIS